MTAVVRFVARLAMVALTVWGLHGVAQVLAAAVGA